MDEEFDELYKQLRGSRCASIVLEARGKFLDGDLVAATKLLESVKETFNEIRWATLNNPFEAPDAKERAALDKGERKQVRRKEKTFETLDQLTALQASLKKLVDRQQRQSRPATTSTTSPPTEALVVSAAQTDSKLEIPKSETVEFTRPLESSKPSVPERIAPKVELPPKLVAALAREKGTPERLLNLGKYFDFGFVDANHEVSAGSLYLVAATTEQNFFVIAGDPPIIDGAVNLFLAVEGQKIKPFALQKFRSYGRDGKITLLKPKPNETVATSPSTETESDTTLAPNNSGSAANGDANQSESDESIVGLPISERDTILDSGAFSQLAEAAQRSGIVPGVSTIIQLRDCEFRLGRYQQALQTMEGIFGAFNGTASQRTQRLLREDAEIASGKLKISPKDLQAKRIRDNAANEAIDRARNRFMRVLDGLRLLLHRVNESQNQQLENE